MMFERFCVLRGKQLLLYESESDANKGANLIRMATVEGFDSETKPDVGYVGITLDDSNLYFSIKVVLNVETGHSIIHAIATDTEQKQRWKRAIKQAGRRVSAVPFGEEGGHMMDTEKLPGFYRLQREESNEEETIGSHFVEAIDEVATAMDRQVDAATDAITGRESPDDCNEVQCSKCRVVFSVMRRRHHCRNCGLAFCELHSSRSIPLPHHGYTEPVRVCNNCFTAQDFSNYLAHYDTHTDALLKGTLEDFHQRVRATYPAHFLTDENHEEWQQDPALIAAMMALSESINRKAETKAKGGGRSLHSAGSGLIESKGRRQTFAAPVPVSCITGNSSSGGAGSSSGESSGNGDTEYVRVGLALIREHWARPAIIRVLVDVLYVMVVPADGAIGGVGAFVGGNGPIRTGHAESGDSEGSGGSGGKLSHATDFDFFWPQYIHLLLVPDLHADSEQRNDLERLLFGIAAHSMHLALLMHWHVRGYMDETSGDERRNLCRRLILHLEGSIAGRMNGVVQPSSAEPLIQSQLSPLSPRHGRAQKVHFGSTPLLESMSPLSTSSTSSSTSGVYDGSNSTAAATGSGRRQTFAGALLSSVGLSADEPSADVAGPLAGARRQTMVTQHRYRSNSAAGMASRGRTEGGADDEGGDKGRIGAGNGSTGAAAAGGDGSGSVDGIAPESGDGSDGGTRRPSAGEDVSSSVGLASAAGAVGGLLGGIVLAPLGAAAMVGAGVVGAYTAGKSRMAKENTERHISLLRAQRIREQKHRDVTYQRRRTVALLHQTAVINSTQTMLHDKVS
jgi:hypothetical protein